MATEPITFDPKDPEEVIPVTFDFSKLAITTISAPQVTATRFEGAADASPSAILSGAPTVTGMSVVQKVIGGVSGCTYALRCRVDTPEGYRWAEVVHLPVLTK